MRYPNLHTEGKNGMMAVKLSREAIFGDELMKRTTVKGYRDLPALSQDGLKVLKEALISLFPQYWVSPASFETLWSKALEAVGQACKRLRKSTTNK